MKKLMTMIGAAVAAFGLFADTVALSPTVIGVDSGDFYEVDSSVLNELVNDGNWYMEEPAEDAALVKAYADGEAPEHPEAFKKAYGEGFPTQDQYVGLDADAPVFRTFAAVAGEEEKSMQQVAIATAERGGIIVDQLVKFSAYDTDTVVPEGLDTENAKIAIWVKTITEEDGETPAVNHLMITAGKLDSMLLPDTETPVVTKELATKNIDVNKFYQLTITAIEAAVGGKNVVPGFKVALDGEDIALAEGLFPTGELDFGGAYTAEGADLIKVNKLFPSLVARTSADAGTLQGVAFKGTGAVDDITVAPKGLYNIEVVIVPPTGAKFGTLVNAEPVAGKDNTYSVTPGATVSGTLVADGAYVVKKADFEFENVSKDTEFTFDDDAVVEAVAQIGDVYYETLAAAVAAANGDTVEVVADCSGAGIFLAEADKKTVTIDLGGKTYTCVGPAVGSNGTASQAFHLEKGNAVTIKNGTITSTENSGVTMLVQNYCDLTVTGVTLDGSNLPQALYWTDSTHTSKVEGPTYTMSNNSGTIALGEGTVIKVSTKTNTGVAFDTCKYGTYDVPSISVDGATINGDVELAGGNLTLTAGTLTGVLKDVGIGDGVITKAAGFTAAAPAGYKWDEQTGILIPCDYVAQIGDDKYESLAAAVAAAKTGDTITLLKSCSGAGIFLAANAGKTITLDLGGFTYTCVGPAVGSNGTASQAFHLEKGNTVTIKDGTVTSTEDSGVTMLVQNYCDLTVTGVTLDGSNLPQALYWTDSTHTSKVEGPTYTMSNNSGTIALGEGTVIKVSTKTNTGVAFDTCKYGTYDVPSITVNGATINGDVELAGGNLTLTAGTLTGVLKDVGIGDGVITKAAGFTAAAPAGYKWDEDGKLVKDEGKEIKPGEIAKDIEAKDAEEALSKVTIKPINAEAEAAGQGAVIKGKATQDPESGKWTVEPVINEAAPEFKAPDVVVETTLEQIVAGTDGEEVTVALPAEKVTPGLYYSVDVATELGAKAEFTEGERVLATGAGVSLKVEKPEGGKAFFKVSEHMAPTPANKD